MLESCALVEGGARRRGKRAKGEATRVSPRCRWSERSGSQLRHSLYLPFVIDVVLSNLSPSLTAPLLFRERSRPFRPTFPPHFSPSRPSGRFLHHIQLPPALLSRPGDERRHLFTAHRETPLLVSRSDEERATKKTSEGKNACRAIAAFQVVGWWWWW